MVLSVGVSFGWTPSVPDTILLPDSLGPLRPGYHLAFGSSSNNIYVASESSDIIVVDGETFQRIKRINTGTPVGGALLVSQHNKLYCSYPQQGRIGVIDCATNSIVRTIDVGTRPKLLCYSSGSDRLYCGDTIDRTVTVIDCATDEVLKTIPVGESLSALEYDPTTGKVYAATRDAVRAISCTADSIVASIDEIKGARGLCVNKRRQKLYVAGRVSPFWDTMYVVSTQVDSVIAELACGYGLAPCLACNELTDRLYAAVNYDSYIGEFDCVGDTLIRRGPLPMYSFSLACDSVRNRLYNLGGNDGGGFLLVLDCSTFHFTSWNGVGECPGILQADPSRYRMLCANNNSRAEASALRVFDYKSDTMYARGATPLCGWRYTMCHNPAMGRLYWGWGPGSGVIDERTNRVVGQMFHVGGELTYSRASNKFYFQADYGSFFERRGLGVMDGSRDSLLKVIDMGDNYGNSFPCWCPDGNKIYCFAEAGARWYIAVTDCSTDSVVRTIDVYDVVKEFQYLGNSRMLCNLLERVMLIDSRTDSVLVDSTTIGAVFALAHTGDGKKVYMVRRDPGRLEVRSSSSLSLLATIDWPYFTSINQGTLLAYSDTTHKLYWFIRDDSALAIDTRRDMVAARMSVGARAACFDHTGRYLFCAGYWDSSLSIYDTQTDSLVAVYPDLPPFPIRPPITPNPDQGCIYVGCLDVILVYPDAPPGVQETHSAEVRGTKAGPTIVRGILNLQPSVFNLQSQIALLSVDGRKVMDLWPGDNDIRRLAPGVYFLRCRQEKCSNKIVVQR